MFSELSNQFDQYFLLVKVSQTEPNLPLEDLAAEVRERLAQLNFIETQLSEISNQYRVTANIEKVNEHGEIEIYNAFAKRDEHLRFVMRLLTESFYYFAFRIRQIVRNDLHRFPGLRGFDCVGVRDVRNHLIEHPEGANSRVFNRTWAWSLESGMQLKPARHQWEKSVFHDKGFRLNASEFAEQLSKSLKRAAQELSSMT